MRSFLNSEYLLILPGLIIWLFLALLTRLTRRGKPVAGWTRVTPGEDHFAGVILGGLMLTFMAAMIWHSGPVSLEDGGWQFYGVLAVIGGGSVLTTGQILSSVPARWRGAKTG